MTIAAGAISLSQILTGLSAAAGTVLSVSSAAYQAEVASMNQEIANENAILASERAQIAAEEQDRLTLGALGEQYSAQAASGLSVEGRSPLAIRKTTRELGRLDALNVINAGEMEAYGHRTQAANFAAQAAARRMDALGAGVGGFLSLGGSLLGGQRGVRNAERYTATPNRRPTSLVY